MLNELEGKFKIDFPNAAKERIEKCSSLTEIIDEDNNIIPFKNKYIRFRKSNQDYLFTYKGSFQNSEFNKTKEIEFKIPYILFQLGKIFSKTNYKKVREVYKHKNATIFLDYVFNLGYFVEIESSKETHIESIKSELLIKAPNIKEHYFQLLEHKNLF